MQILCKMTSQSSSLDEFVYFFLNGVAKELSDLKIPYTKCQKNIKLNKANKYIDASGSDSH